MPFQLRAVPGTNTLYATFQATLFYEDKTTLWDKRYPNGNRGPVTSDRSWTQDGGRWPSRTGFTNDPATPASVMFNQDLGNGSSPGDFCPRHYGNQGNQSLKFIMGRCLDVSSNGVSGAVVQGFVTATDTYVRETTADSNGYYELGTEYPATNHYLVAYRAGAPDIAGTTVNTLQGTNRDGT